MKKYYLIILITILLILSLFLLIYFYPNEDKTSQVCIKQTCFQVEIADNQAERQKGLMDRSSLNDDEGMFFIFENEGIYPFWMKNTFIPLDIIWINKDKEIIHIESVQPCKIDPCPSYNPEKEALYVLEINSGLSEKYGFKEGNEITISNNI